MWVRNQDKGILTNGTVVYFIRRLHQSIQGVSEYEWIICIRHNTNIDDIDGWLSLAKYSTKEKAIKVMDMFEKHIKKSNHYYTVYNGEMNRIVTQEQTVFQFPKDEDVK